MLDIEKIKIIQVSAPKPLAKLIKFLQNTIKFSLNNTVLIRESISWWSQAEKITCLIRKQQV